VPFRLQVARHDRLHQYVVGQLATEERPEVSPVTIRLVTLVRGVTPSTLTSWPLPAKGLKSSTRFTQPSPAISAASCDVGEGRRFVLNLWESKEHSAAALSVLGPEVGLLLGPLMSGPSEFIGVGNVISSDLVPSGG